MSTRLRLIKTFVTKYYGEKLEIGRDISASRQRSHRLLCSPNGQLLPIQPRKDGKAKLYQVQQFINYQQEEE